LVVDPFAFIAGKLREAGVGLAAVVGHKPQGVG
jgi:hypothetical protein